jgi:hypothetical protein
MTPLHDDYPQCAQAREEAMLAERAKARDELRDRFAGYALIGLLAGQGGTTGAAVEAWKLADEMMKARGHE